MIFFEIFNSNESKNFEYKKVYNFLEINKFIPITQNHNFINFAFIMLR